MRRSRSRSRERHRSRSRSRDRQHHSGTSSGYPPMYAAAPMVPMPLAGGMQMPMPGHLGVPAPPIGMPYGVNPMIASMLQQAVTPAFAPAPDKTELELFVGNTPQGTSEFVLLNFLNAAMAQVHLNTAPGAPIIQCRVSSKFAFIELRSAQEATNALSLSGIPFMGVPLKIGRPSKYRGPPMQTRTWQELTGQAPLPAAAAAGGGTGSGLDPSTKVYRELYIGNCTPQMTEASIAEFLGTTLQKVGLATPAPGNPVAMCRSSGNFCFIEMRSIEDANAMLNLNGIPFQGNMLKIGRPAKYPGPHTHALSWPDVLAKLMADGAALGAAAGGAPPPAQTPTRVLRLNNMLTADDLADEEGLADIEEETKTECTVFGPVRKVHIVRPSTTDASAAKTATGVGYVFVEFEEPDAARKAMLSLSTRTFDGKKVEVVFWDEGKFAAADYGDST